MHKINDLHIDDFCKDVAKIWLQLYARFPVKGTIYVEDIAGPDTPDEFGLHSNRFQAGFATLIWLAENDYLQFGDTIRQEAVDEAVLSHRAFMLLSAYDSQDASSGLKRIDCLKTTLRDGTSDELKHLVLQYLST